MWNCACVNLILPICPYPSFFFGSHKFVFCVAVSLFLFCKEAHWSDFFFRFHVWMISCDICLSPPDLTSLSMIISRSICVDANYIISFFFRANIPLYMYATSSFCIYLLMDTQVAFMSSLIVTSVAVNIGVHLSFQMRALSFLDICSRVGLLDHKVTLFLDF